MTATVLIGLGHGGTGKTTASESFIALSPITAKGDLIIANTSTTAAALHLGTAGTVIGIDSTSGLPAYKSSLYGATGLNAQPSLVWTDVNGHATVIVPPAAGTMISPVLTLDSATNIPSWVDAGT